MRLRDTTSAPRPEEHRRMKTSLGIWALGPMITRFVPVGYQPEHANEPTAVKVRRAVDGLGDLMDDYEFHYPGELNPDNLDEVRDALDGHGIACDVHRPPHRPALRQGRAHVGRRGDAGRGAAPDPGDRRARRLDRREHDLLARDRGLQLPVPDPVRRSRGSGSSRGWPRRRRSARSTASSSSSSTRTPSPR